MLSLYLFIILSIYKIIGGFKLFLPRELSFFEKLFEMESGYVLDFSRDGLKNFIRDSVNLDVFTPDYLYHVKKRFKTDSMSNILKYFWETEDFNKTLKLISDLVDYYEAEYGDENETKNAKMILNRHYNPVNIETDITDEKRIIDLINEINHIMDERQPIFALVKLHTLTQNILRQICDSHNIQYTKTEGIDSLFKKYSRFLKQNNYIETKMSKTIFRNSGTMLSQFNEIRNNYTYAHDNPILNQFESEFIFKQVANILFFIENIDEKFKLKCTVNKNDITRY